MSTMNVFHLVHKITQFINSALILLIIYALAAPTIFSATHEIPNFPLAVAKPNCTHKCGNISIPYPFGTTQNCYQSNNFLVTCKQNSNPPKLFMQNTSLQITHISLDGQLKLLQNIAHECYSRNSSRISRNDAFISLPIYMTVNDTANRFTVMGCDAYGFLVGRRFNRNYETGCTAKCVVKSDLEQGSCTGLGCCQTSISKDVRRIKLAIGSYFNNSFVWDFNKCNYAFLVEESFNFSPENFNNLRNVRKLPMVADWAIGNSTCENARTNSSSYACKGLNSECYKPNNGYGYRCRCKEGYQGNPYLDEGCQDIDECQDPVLNICERVCVNNLGGFNCICPKGYHGDGRRGGRGCTRYESVLYKLAAGIAVGVIFVLLVICWLYFEFKRRSWMVKKQKNFLQNGGLLLQEKLNKVENNTARIYTSTELQKATKNFHDSMIIGQGGYGTVYKGFLEKDKMFVAIKKSKEVSPNQIDQFTNEVIILSQINHKNVVKLLGCCLEMQVPLLVYEFISNGTLFEQLHSLLKNNFLNWATRLKIAVETAGVLSYLHSTASTPIIHRDVKSANILLDHTFTAKVSDFGASKLVLLDQTQLSTLVQGTLGYLDPEYMQTNQLTEKSDVYSFGVVLVELLTSKKVISYDRPKEQIYFVHFFLTKLKENHLFEVLDEDIVCEENKEQLIEVARLAQVCLNVKGEDRPSMKEVAMQLEGLRLGSKHPWAQNSDEIETLIRDGLNGFVSDDNGNSTSFGSESELDMGL